MSKAIILAGCNGVGKSTIIDALIHDTELRLTRFPRHTTRQIRDGETHGIQYFFVSDEEFDSHVQSGDFIDIDQFPSGKYGTSKSTLKDCLNNGYLLFEVDPENALVLKKAFIEMGIPVVDVFIQPIETSLLSQPSGLDETLALLEKRLRAKKLSDFVIEDRINEARTRLFMGNQFSQVITNKDGQIEKAINEVRKLIKGDDSE